MMSFKLRREMEAIEEIVTFSDVTNFIGSM